MSLLEKARITKYLSVGLGALFAKYGYKMDKALVTPHLLLSLTSLHFLLFGHFGSLTSFPAQAREPWTLPLSRQLATSRVVRTLTPQWLRAMSLSRGYACQEHNLIWSHSLQRGCVSLDLGVHLLAGHLQGV